MPRYQLPACHQTRHGWPQSSFLTGSSRSVTHSRIELWHLPTRAASGHISADAAPPTDQAAANVPCARTPPRTQTPRTRTSPRTQTSLRTRTSHVPKRPHAPGRPMRPDVPVHLVAGSPDVSMLLSRLYAPASPGRAWSACARSPAVPAFPAFMTAGLAGLGGTGLTGQIGLRHRGNWDEFGRGWAG